MTNIKPLAQSADKWQRRTTASTQDYVTGVQNPRKSWQAAASAGEKNYEQGVTSAISRKSYGKGVKNAGDAAWQKGATTKGPGRFAEGAAGAAGDFSDGYAPYQQAIASLTLPERGPKGSPANLQRVNTVATALRSVFEKRA